MFDLVRMTEEHLQALRAHFRNDIYETEGAAKGWSSGLAAAVAAHVGVDKMEMPTFVNELPLTLQKIVLGIETEAKTLAANVETEVENIKTDLESMVRNDVGVVVANPASVVAADNVDETAHLQASEANAERLADSVQQVADGTTQEHELIEPAEESAPEPEHEAEAPAPDAESESENGKVDGESDTGEQPSA